MEERAAYRPKGRRARNWMRRAAVFVIVLAGVWTLGWFLSEHFDRNSAVQTGQPLRGTQESSDPGDAAAGQAPLDNEVFQNLQVLTAQDRRVQEIIDHSQNYPEALLKMLSKNLDMLDFVLDYPEKNGQVFADTIGEVKAGEIPLLLQYDQRWGYGSYGGSSVAVSGCGPTCLSMVVAGLTGENTVTPYVVAQYAYEQGFYVSGSGTGWTLMSKGAAHFDVIGEELPLTKSKMESALNEGHPIICSMRPGDFTSTGHFIVITGMRDGQFTVNDPNSTERSHMLWDYETLEPQISNLWAFRVQ